MLLRFDRLRLLGLPARDDGLLDRSASNLNTRTHTRIHTHARIHARVHVQHATKCNDPVLSDGDVPPL